MASIKSRYSKICSTLRSSFANQMTKCERTQSHDYDHSYKLEIFAAGQVTGPMIVLKSSLGLERGSRAIIIISLNFPSDHFASNTVMPATSFHLFRLLYRSSGSSEVPPPASSPE